MTSHPPGQCCLVGVKHEGTATGSMNSIANYESYVATPKNGSNGNGIIILTDVMGHVALNAQLIADQLAANGYLVVMPDLFNGDPIPEARPATFDFQAWRSGHDVPTVDPIVGAVIQHMRSEMGIQRLGAVGYCFGGKYVCRFLKPSASASLLDVGYIAHPSFVSADELAAIDGPLSIAAAETDHIFPADKRHESEEILKDGGKTYQLTLYSGVAHGFAVRGDIKKKVSKFAKEAAFLQAVAWFDEWLKE